MYRMFLWGFVDIVLVFRCGFQSRSYQQAVVAPRPLIPYAPLNPSNQWVFGVFGRNVDENEHLEGGEYYNNATLAATYKQNIVIDISVEMVAYHDNFIAFFICDVDKCPGGDISRRCFVERHCR